MQIAKASNGPRLIRPDLSMHRLRLPGNPTSKMTVKIPIPEEVKTGGTIPTKFNVTMSQEGPTVDVTA